MKNRTAPKNRTALKTMLEDIFWTTRVLIDKKSNIEFDLIIEAISLDSCLTKIMDKKPSSFEEIVEENRSFKDILSLLISKLHEVQHENEILQNKFDSLKSANFFHNIS